MKPRTRRDVLRLIEILRDAGDGIPREHLCDALRCSDGRLSYLIQCARSTLGPGERIVYLWATWRGISWTRWKIVNDKPRQLSLEEVLGEWEVTA